MLQEREILIALKAGKEEGMDALFERWYRPMVVFADSYLHDLQEAEDLVQEQMIKLWSAKVFAGVVVGALGTFLFTVIRNACINWRKKKRLPVTALEELSSVQLAWEEAVRMDEAGIQLLREALQQLPERTRLVVECVVLQEKQYKKAAEELGVSVNTIKTLLRQGIKELRERLKGKRECIFFLMLDL
jgi:RNA polymerase sigma-70 factor (ECF subfamily)